MRINIYSEINEELLEDLQEQLEGDCDYLEIHLNSAGGSVITGLKVISMIQSKGVPTTCYIEFLAASMAADIAMTCDKVYMNKYALLMFHDAWSPNELSDSQKEYLIKQSEMMCKMVSEKRNIDYNTFKQYCKEEKWFIAEEALEAGLIDGIEEKMGAEVEYDEIMELYSNKQFDLLADVCKKMNTKNMEESIEPIKEVETVETVEIVEAEISKIQPMIHKEDMEEDEKEDLIMECDKLKKEIEMLKGELSRYKEKEAKMKKETLDIEISNIVEEALKEGKIQEKNEWVELLETDFTKFSTIIKNLPTNSKKSFDILTNVIGKSVNNNENWTYKDWSKKDPNGLLKLLKENKSEYSRLFKEQFGVEYNG